MPTRVLVLAAAVAALTACSGGGDDHTLVPPAAAAVALVPSTTTATATTVVETVPTSTVPGGARIPISRTAVGAVTLPATPGPACAEAFGAGRSVDEIVAAAGDLGAVACVNGDGAATLTYVDGLECTGDGAWDLYLNGYGWGRPGGVWAAGESPGCG